MSIDGGFFGLVFFFYPHFLPCTSRDRETDIGRRRKNEYVQIGYGERGGKQLCEQVGRGDEAIAAAVMKRGGDTWALSHSSIV